MSDFSVLFFLWTPGGYDWQNRSVSIVTHRVAPIWEGERRANHGCRNIQ